VAHAPRAGGPGALAAASWGLRLQASIVAKLQHQPARRLGAHAHQGRLALVAPREFTAGT